MAREADLFVVCKNCSSEVSPYVTECPYCGQRVRKRAPKIERNEGGEPSAPKSSLRDRARTRRAGKPATPGRSRPGAGTRSGPVSPRLGRLRRGELPGLAVDGRPVITIALVGACFAVYLLGVAGAFSPFRLVLQGPLGDEPSWRALSAPFVHYSGGGRVFAGGAYQFATMVGVGLFGWLLERRHGFIVVVGVALVAGAGGMALAGLLDPDRVAFGANGMALGLLGAWVMPDLRAWRRDDEYEGDLLGTAVIATVLLLMPLAVTGASAVAGVSGALGGLVLGFALARRSA